MKTRIGFGVLGMLAIAAAAQADRLHSTSAEYLSAPGSDVVWGGSAGGGSLLFGTGFESPFTPGSINGQQGWTTFAGNPATPAISAAHPAGGSQHLRNSKGPGSSGSLNGAFSPNFGPQPAGRYIVSVDFASNDPGGADHMLVGQAPSQGFLSWRLHFTWQNQILVLDRTSPGGSLVFVNTGHTWSPDGQYRNVTVDFDADADQIRYYYGGNLVWETQYGIVAGTSIEQVILFGDNFYNPGGWGDWDNLSVTIPAPGALALLGLAGLAGTGRRRRN
jgi:hypothetical protein